MHEYDRNAVAARVPVPKPGIRQRRQRPFAGTGAGSGTIRLAPASGVFWATAVPTVIAANNAKAIQFRISFMAFSIGEVLPEGFGTGS
jgi:hypothetical protein